MIKDIYSLHNIDARQLDRVIDRPIVDVTITSPPYFDMKDYGIDNQLGYGQEYDEYLDDLSSIFKKIYEVTKDTGSLWIILDTFRKDGEIIPLPFDVADRIQKIGWKFQDIIIWNKTKTIPWSKRGQMRNIFEYILVFVKTENYKYYIDRIRDFETLKRWWIKYPERYNPKGKTPEEIWNFTIPTQGSWGNGYVRHFCPLPTELIENILKLTTDENDTVLDPFAGSGSVLIQAAYMNRKFIGFELNNEFIKQFNRYLKKTIKNGEADYNTSKEHSYRQDTFQELILNLRALKFAKVLCKKLREYGWKGIEYIYVEIKPDKPDGDFKLIKVKYSFLLKEKTQKERIETDVQKIIVHPPLSKYGIEPEFGYYTDKRHFMKRIPEESYLYGLTNTHCFKHKINSISDLKKPGIISQIRLEIDENAFEGDA